jgi:methionyl-tRNA formyltransferase
MIRVYTKERHMEKITKFLNSINLEHEIFTNVVDKKLGKFELGISYCYPKKISKSLLSIPKKGFVNYHPGPLPEYKGPSEYENAIKNKESKWGVTVHHMNEDFDSGKIIQVNHFDLHESANSIEELGAISHYFLFNLFKDTIKKIYENN